MRRTREPAARRSAGGLAQEALTRSWPRGSTADDPITGVRRARPTTPLPGGIVARERLRDRIGDQPKGTSGSDLTPLRGVRPTLLDSPCWRCLSQGLKPSWDRPQEIPDPWPKSRICTILYYRAIALRRHDPRGGVRGSSRRDAPGEARMDGGNDGSDSSQRRESSKMWQHDS